MSYPSHRPRPQCWPCIMDISLAALDRATNDEKTKFDAMREIAVAMARNLSQESNLPVVSTRLFRMIAERTGNPDPFREEKLSCNRVALPMAERLSREILQIDDPVERLRSAALASIAGNTMDLGTSGHSFDLKHLDEEYRRTVEQGLAIDNTPDLLFEVDRCEDVLYLADNAGEIAFDKILVQVISRLGPAVTVAVKGGPISNDATLEDAAYVKMDEVASVITTGTAHLGINLGESSDEFIRAFRSADLILSKGQSNLETICHDGPSTQPVAFVLKVKCQPIAMALGAKLGDNVLKIARPPG